jgi:transposase
MARDFRPVNRDAVMLLPPDLREWLVLDVVDRLDLSGIEAGYRLGWTGRQAYDPRMLTALLIYAYCQGVRSSRMLERACVTDVACRVIAAQQRPDHTTLARFRAAHAAGLADLFGQVLAICGRAGLGRVGVVAVDGTKIAANASPRRTHDEDRLRKLAAGILADAERVDAMEDAEHGDRRGDELPPRLRPGPSRRRHIEAALDAVEQEKRARKAADVADAQAKAAKAGRSLDKARERAEASQRRGKKAHSDRMPISEHKKVRDAQARLDAAEQAVEAADRGQGPRSTDDEPVRRNLTDPDSRLIRSRGKAFLQGFNAQLVVSDDHLVLATDLTNCSNDVASFNPMLALLQANLAEHLPDRQLGTVLADAGYCSVEALTSDGPDRLIAVGRDPDSPGRSRRHTAIEAMAQRLKPGSPDRATYGRRQATVEPVIGHLKDRIGLRRFSRRGIQAARHELAFAAMTHNIRRLATH